MSKKLRIGLFGFGVVGHGFHELLTNTQSDKGEIVKIAVKDKTKSRTLPTHYFVYDKNAILNDSSIDVVVEAINDYKESFEIVSAALKNKKHVVTANKKMVAHHLDELIQLQKENNVTLLYEASSCGSIPIIRLLEDYFKSETLKGVEGIFNGTSNYILTKIFNENLDYDLALKQAQDLGFAETDPTSDVEGFDAKYKLCIIALHAIGAVLKPEDVLTLGINHISADDIRYAVKKGLKIRLVPSISRQHNDLAVFVLPQFIKETDLLFRIDNEFNAVRIDAPYSGEQFIKGKGAGSHPTGSAVLKDVLSLQEGYKYQYTKHVQGQGKTNTDVLLEVYIRYQSDELKDKLKFESISETFSDKQSKYIIGYVALKQLIENRELFTKDKTSIITTGNRKFPVNGHAKNGSTVHANTLTTAGGIHESPFK